MSNEREHFSCIYRIEEGRPKNNGGHFEGEILALFGDHLFCGRMGFFV